MKKITILIAIAVSLLTASCNKNDSTISVPDQTQSAPGAPAIVNVITSKVYEAGDYRPMFKVTVSVPVAGSVTKINMYRVPAFLNWYVNNPTSGDYIMYDHTEQYPTFSASVFYYFEIVMKDGSKTLTTPFQVY